MTTSGHLSHHFGPLYSTNSDTETLQTVIADLRMRHKIIFECCGRIVHKADSCIIRGPEFFPPIIRIHINQFNVRHGDEPTEPPIECNRQPPEYHFKSKTYPPKTIPVVSSIMGRLNHCSLDNVDVEVHPSEFPVEYKSESILNTETTPIKSIGYY